jgi:cardiolipin synthase
VVIAIDGRGDYQNKIMCASHRHGIGLVPSGVSTGRWLAGLGLLALLLSGCASLPSAMELAERTERSPVLTRRGALNEKRADAVLQTVAGAASGTERAEVNTLMDAWRGHRLAVRGRQQGDAADRWSETFSSCVVTSAKPAAACMWKRTYFRRRRHRVRQSADRQGQAGCGACVVDALGSIDTTSALFATMREGGVQLIEFRPLLSLNTLPWRYHNRDHRKILIVDGKIAFTGGLNISGTYSSGSSLRPGPERGVTSLARHSCQVEGPVVQQFQAIFFETWERLGGGVGADSGKYFPVLPQADGDVVAAVASAGVRQRDESIYSTYMAAVEKAAQRIWVTQAYFLPPPELKRVHCGRAARRRCAGAGAGIH